MHTNVCHCGFVPYSRCTKALKLWNPQGIATLNKLIADHSHTIFVWEFQGIILKNLKVLLCKVYGIKSDDTASL